LKSTKTLLRYYINNLEKLREVIMQIVENPDEIHADVVRNDVMYYLKRLNDM